MRHLSNALYNYQDCFDFKNVKMLFEYNDANYVIDLFFKIELLYNLLYVLFEKKLYILRNYFLKNLLSKCVRKSINNANALIFFVSKRNEFLRFYINYRNLNTITIKNRCSLSLIEKTLNYLVNVVYFTKFDLKNVYYRICIRKNNK